MTVKINIWFRNKIKRQIDPVLLEQVDLREDSTIHFSSLEMLGIALLSNMDTMCMWCFIINVVFNQSFLAMIYPFSYFLYALIENPFPPKQYWKFMSVYSGTLIVIKFIYQLPFFCGNPMFSVYTPSGLCDTSYVDSLTLWCRFDYLLGIYKFNGIYSVPEDLGIF